MLSVCRTRRNPERIFIMKQPLTLLAAFLIMASSCGTDADSTSALEALGFSADEAACYNDAYDTAGFDISEVLQSNDLSDEDAATRDQIAADCSGATVDDNTAEDDGADETGSNRSLDDLSALEREMVEGMMAEGVAQAGALCVVDAIQNEDIDLGQLLRAGDDADELLSPEMMTVVFRCMDELFDPDSFSFDEFREPSDFEGGTYGDDSTLDALWDACGGGDGAACDELYWISPVDSEYEEYGNTCGNRKKDGVFSCEAVIGGGEVASAGDAMFYGDDVYLDNLWDACADGDGLACDDLYIESPFDSEYESFGDTCGYMLMDRSSSCADVNLSGPFNYGDDADLDILWESCSSWDFAACDELWLVSPVDSIYEEFGATCAWYFEDGLHDCERELGELSEGSATFYGDDPQLDLIWDDCETGVLSACDDLYWMAPVGSDYESFGSTCGNLGEPTYGECVGPAMNYGDDPYLDGIYDDCADGNLYACDELYQMSSFDSEYEAFGNSCGGLAIEEQWGSCAENLGD
jgi:hypothetical protein